MDLDALYQDILLDHFRHPRNHGALADAEVRAEEENPNCGDHIRLAVDWDGDRVRRIRHDGHGCAISTASASMMSEAAAGRSAAEINDLADGFIAMMRDERPFAAGRDEDLAALEGVKKFPLRVKCATMCWHALKKAVQAPPPPGDRPAQGAEPPKEL